MPEKSKKYRVGNNDYIFDFIIYILYSYYMISYYIKYYKL